MFNDVSNIIFPYKSGRISKLQIDYGGHRMPPNKNINNLFNRKYLNNMKCFIFFRN